MLTSSEQALMERFKKKMLESMGCAHPDQVRIITLRSLESFNSWWIEGEFLLDGYDKFIFSAVYSPRDPVDRTKH